MNIIKILDVHHSIILKILCLKSYMKTKSMTRPLVHPPLFLPIKGENFLIGCRGVVLNSRVRDFVGGLNSVLRHKCRDTILLFLLIIIVGNSQT